jgi:hypothetical protein
MLTDTNIFSNLTETYRKSSEEEKQQKKENFELNSLIL